MPLMTPFHHSQFHSPILVEVGQILRHTFSNVSKNHDPSSLQVQKKKWSHMTWHIPGKILIWPHTVTPVTSSHNSPSTNFLWIWHITAECDKIVHTGSPDHLGQIQLPWASMPLMTPFHHSQFHSPILVEVGRILWHTFSNVSKNHDPSSVWVQKSNRMKYDTQIKMVPYDLAHTRQNLNVTPNNDLCNLCPQLTFN